MLLTRACYSTIAGVSSHGNVMLINGEVAAGTLDGPIAGSAGGAAVTFIRDTSA